MAIDYLKKNKISETDGEDGKRWHLFHHSNPRQMGRMAIGGTYFTTILIQEKWEDGNRLFKEK